MTTHRLLPSDHLQLLESMQYCVLLHDAVTKEIVWANRAACEVLEFTVDELKPLKAPDMSSHERQYRREIGVHMLHQAVENGRSEWEWCYRSKSGVDIISHVVAVLVPLESGPVVMVQFREIAAEKAMRESLRQVEEERRRDARYIEYLARYNVMGDMAMAIAHEVSQPITAASNFLAGVRGRLDGRAVAPEELRWGLEHSIAQLDRARQILTSLRQYATRLEQAERLADLSDIVRESAYFADLRAAGSAVDLRYELAAEPLPIRCEGVLIGQVVTNLAFNAVDEMAGWPRGERQVTIATCRRRNHAVLTVADHGRGLGHIPAGSLFDGAFTSKPHGSGIGLALSYRIIARHRGRIDARENEPRGAVVTVELPLVAG